MGALFGLNLDVREVDDFAVDFLFYDSHIGVISIYLLLVGPWLSTQYWLPLFGFLLVFGGGTKVHFRLGVNNGKFEHLLVHCPKLLIKYFFWGANEFICKAIKVKRYVDAFIISFLASVFFSFLLPFSS